MIDEMPVLLIVVPLLGAVAALIVGQVRPRLGWVPITLAALTHLGLAGSLFASVVRDGPVTYAAGGFEIPYGIELVADGIAAVLAVTIAVVFVAVLVYARQAGPHTTPFYSLLGLLIAGLSGMTLTGDAFNLYVFLEIAGLAAYALVATGEDADAAVAGFKYLLIGTIGASLYLLGVGLLLIATGTLNMADLADQIQAVGYTSPLVMAAFGLIVGGLAVKVALFPVHTWQPDAYATSPASVATIVSALVSTVAAYALGRMLLSVFTVNFFGEVPIARTAVVTVAAVSIVAGSVLAVLQTDVRRMLAYSSVSQFGMVVAAFAVATPTAVVGAVIHLAGHAIMKGGLFATTGLVSARTGARTISEYRRLNERAPIGAAAFAVLALAMVGVPPAIGFVGKWYIVLGAIEAGQWVLVAVLLSSTLLTLAYFAAIVERMYFAGEETATATTSVSAPNATDAAGAATAPDGSGSRPVSLGMLLVVVGAAVAAVALGAGATVVETVVRATVEGVIPGL